MVPSRGLMDFIQAIKSKEMQEKGNVEIKKLIDYFLYLTPLDGAYDDVPLSVKISDENLLEGNFYLNERVAVKLLEVKYIQDCSTK